MARIEHEPTFHRDLMFDTCISKDISRKKTKSPMPISIIISCDIEIQHKLKQENPFRKAKSEIKTALGKEMKRDKMLKQLKQKELLKMRGKNFFEFTNLNFQ